MTGTGGTSVLVYGKDDCPYTSKARKDLEGKGFQVEYRNVRTSPEHLKEMLDLTNGTREVPVVVENGRVTIGWGGGA